MSSAEGSEVGDVVGDEPVPGAAGGPADLIRRTAIAMSALSQGGLTYGENDYDLDRYRKLAKLAADLLAAVTEQ